MRVCVGYVREIGLLIVITIAEPVRCNCARQRFPRVTERRRLYKGIPNGLRLRLRLRQSRPGKLCEFSAYTIRRCIPVNWPSLIKPGQCVCFNGCSEAAFQRFACLRHFCSLRTEPTNRTNFSAVTKELVVRSRILSSTVRCVCACGLYVRVPITSGSGDISLSEVDRPRQKKRVSRPNGVHTCSV